MSGSTDATKPEFILVEVSRGTDHRWTVEGPDDLLPTTWSDEDFDSLSDAVDHAIQRRYGDSLTAAGVDVDYAWMPWGDPTSDTAPAGRTIPHELGTDPMFELTRGAHGCSITLMDGDPTFEVQAARMADLPDLIAAELVRHWPELVGVPPFGTISWSRTLTAAGFVNRVPTAESDTVDPADLQATREATNRLLAAVEAHRAASSHLEEVREGRHSRAELQEAERAESARFAELESLLAEGTGSKPGDRDRTQARRTGVLGLLHRVFRGKPDRPGGPAS